MMIQGKRESRTEWAARLIEMGRKQEREEIIKLESGLVDSLLLLWAGEMKSNPRDSINWAVRSRIVEDFKWLRRCLKRGKENT